MMDEREDRLDAMLRDAAQDYNAPPPTPRAEMWARISAAVRRSGGAAEGQGARGADGQTGRGVEGQEGGELPFRQAVRPTARPTVRLAVGIAALVALGIGIGRFTAPNTPGTSRTAAPTQTAQVPATDTGSQGVAQPGPAPTQGGTVPADGRRGVGLGGVDRTGLPTLLATTEHLTHVETFLTEFTTRDAPVDFAGQAQDLLGTTRLLLDSKRVRDVRTRKLLEDLELILVQIAALDSTRSEERGFIADGLAQNHLRTRLRNAIPVGPAIRM